MAEIVLDRISRRFPDGSVAVRDTSLTIGDGEFFILVGPSGSGKSTLLNLIVGLEQPTDGEIRVDGEVVNHLDPKDRNMAMVFQSYAIYPHMSVRENLAFPLRLAGMAAQEIGQRVERTARTLGLTELLDRRPGSLSGGQRQRVAMGRAMVREPRAFLLDEPLSNLDAQLRAQMRAELARLQRRLGTTTVYVTHDQTEAMTLGDRVAVLDGGVVQQVGTPRELYEQPANLFVAGFIGSPGMRFVPGRLEGSRLIMPMVELDLPQASRLGAARGRPVVVGVRPEHVAPSGDTEPSSEGVFRARVDVCEWLGADLFVYLEPASPGRDAGLPGPPKVPMADQPNDSWYLMARLDPAQQITEGEELLLTLGAGNLHLFDAETGMNLLRPDPWRPRDPAE
jgi:multiple sugar transport system ATP-binding protein